MFKVMMMLKRKPGMSMDEFIEYYETEHAPLVVRSGTKFVEYRRHYLTPLAHVAFDDLELDAAYDVITEVVYPDRETFLAQQEAMRANPERLAAIQTDEEDLFDRTVSRCVFVETRQSDLGG